MYSLLNRLAARILPVHLDSIADIEKARQLKKLDLIEVAIPQPSKGRNDYGAQAPAIVITPRRHKRTKMRKSKFIQCSNQKFNLISI